MFKMATSPTFWATVLLEATAEDGRRVKGELELKYKRKTLDEVQAIMDSEDRKDADIARDIVVDWRKVDDGDGGERQFSLEALDEILDYGYGGPIVTTYFSNYPKARVKN